MQVNAVYYKVVARAASWSIREREARMQARRAFSSLLQADVQFCTRHAHADPFSQSRILFLRPCPTAELQTLIHSNLPSGNKKDSESIYLRNVAYRRTIKLEYRISFIVRLEFAIRLQRLEVEIFEQSLSSNQGFSSTLVDPSINLPSRHWYVSLSLSFYLLTFSPSIHYAGSAVTYLRISSALEIEFSIARGAHVCPHPGKNVARNLS